MVQDVHGEGQCGMHELNTLGIKALSHRASQLCYTGGVDLAV